MSEEFQRDPESGRFEYHVEDRGTVFANCREEHGTLFIDYVEAPPQLRGTGAAGELMEYIAETAREEGLRVVPICGYAASWLRRHKEYADLVD